MAFDTFLKISDIPGESTDDKHKDWIEITSFSHGVDQPYSDTASSAGGATAERADFDSFTITKEVDIASPKLYEASFTGKHLKEVIIEACRSGTDKQKYLEIKMEQVLITSYRQNGGDSFPTEYVSFRPGKITMTYVKQQRDGGQMGGNVVTGWDLTQNKIIA
jgi:type VI secretion system secreted protein Hcp